MDGLPGGNGHRNDSQFFFEGRRAIEYRLIGGDYLASPVEDQFVLPADQIGVDEWAPHALSGGGEDGFTLAPFALMVGRCREVDEDFGVLSFTGKRGVLMGKPRVLANVDGDPNSANRKI